MEQFIKYIDTESVSFFARFKSSNEQKIATLRGNTIVKIYQNGEDFKPSLIFANYDRVAIIDMTPKTSEVSFKNGIVTSDGISIEGKLSISFNISEFNMLSDEYLRRVLINEKDEIDLLFSSVSKELQDFVKNIKAIEVRKYVAEATKILKKLENQLSIGCFRIVNINVLGFNISNTEINSIVDKAIKDEETATAKYELTKKNLQYEDLIQSLKLKEQEGEFEIEKIKNLFDIETRKAQEEHNLNVMRLKEEQQISLQKLLEEQKLDIEKKKIENEIYLKKQIAEELKTEHGQLAFLPEQTHSRLMKILEIKLIDSSEKNKLLHEFARLNINAKNAYKEGQYDISVNSFNALLQAQLGIRMVNSKFEPLTEDEEATRISEELNKNITTQNNEPTDNNNDEPLINK